MGQVGMPAAFSHESINLFETPADVIGWPEKRRHEANERATLMTRGPDSPHHSRASILGWNPWFVAGLLGVVAMRLLSALFRARRDFRRHSVSSAASAIARSSIGHVMDRKVVLAQAAPSVEAVVDDAAAKAWMKLDRHRRIVGDGPGDFHP